MNKIEFLQRKEAAALANYSIGPLSKEALANFAAKREGKTTKDKPRVLNTTAVQAALACGRPIPTRTVNPNFEPRR
jgi:hypothetical protein